MVVRKVGVVSVAKILAALYAGMGLLIGGVFALISLVSAGWMAGQDGPAWLGAVFGVGAVVLLPIFYGLLGLIGGAIMAALYNLFAGMVGGIELDLQ